MRHLKKLKWHRVESPMQGKPYYWFARIEKHHRIWCAWSRHLKCWTITGDSRVIEQEDGSLKQLPSVVYCTGHTPEKCRRWAERHDWKNEQR